MQNLKQRIPKLQKKVWETISSRREAGYAFNCLQHTYISIKLSIKKKIKHGHKLSLLNTYVW
jgi:hypothetical protein